MKMSYIKLRKKVALGAFTFRSVAEAHLQRLEYNAAVEALNFNIPTKILRPSVVIKNTPFEWRSHADKFLKS